MPRRKLRSQGEVVERSRALGDELRAALAHLPSDDPAVVDAIWRGEALGTLLWALQLTELPSYDQPFDPEEVAAVELNGADLRDSEEVELERESARLWHWRARTTSLQAAGAVELPERYATFDQLIAATAMRGFEAGVLPPPLRGGFQAYRKGYPPLSPAHPADAHPIPLQGHHPPECLCGDARAPGGRP